jgi:transposase
MILKYSLGLDISKQDFKACLSTIDNLQRVKVQASRSFLNTKSGLIELEKWFVKHQVQPNIQLVICMEATGVYHENCSYFLANAGYQVSIILPNKAKSYLQSIGLKSKNDKIDAKGLAQMGAEKSLEIWQPIGIFYYELRVLTRHHQTIQENLTAERNRLHANINAAFQVKLEINQLEKHIKFLEKQLVEIKKGIDEKINSDEKIKLKCKEVCKIKGISNLSCATILAETGGFELFKNYKQVVSYAGFDVVENQSGNHKGKTRISKKGNTRIRRILYMPALTAMQDEKTNFGKLYRRIIDKTEFKKKGIVAVSKKLLTTIYFIIKNDLVYDAYFNNIQKEEQVSSSPSALKKPKQTKKVATTSVTTQGKHPASYRSMHPLRKTKIKENLV